MSKHIKQSKFLNSISAEILPSRGVLEFSSKKFLRAYSREVPLEHINPDEIQQFKIDFTFFFLGLGLIALGLMWVFDCFIHLKIFDMANAYDSLIMNLAAIAVGVLGLLFISGGILTILNAIADSSKTAHYRSYLDNQPLLFFYCSRKYTPEYEEFKNALLDEIERIKKQKYLKEFFTMLSDQLLIDVLPEIIIPEMKLRKLAVDSYLQAIINRGCLDKKDNVIPIS